MKTLYEILEVSEGASKEVIEKAYKVLAKKHHPDLQPTENKANAEKKMKEINEAYSILSDEIKRKKYDETLKQKREEEQKQNTIHQENNKREERLNYNNAQTTYQNQTSSQRPMTQAEYQEAKRREQEYMKQQQKMQKDIQKNIQAQYEQRYQQAYEDYLKSLGYKIKYKWTWENYKELLITILIIIGIAAILWFFPPTHKWIMDFYNSNNVIKTIIDIIGSIFVGIWNAICSIFN